MPEARFKVAYAGEALSDGEMEVGDLAPALLGIAEMLKAAGRVVDGDDAEISVRVRATNVGSFEVLLAVVVHAAKAGWAFLETPDGQAAAALLSLLGISAGTIKGGAIGLVRKLKGKVPRRVTRKDDSGLVTIEAEGVTFEVPEAVARLALDGAVRAAMERAIAHPLQKDGIEKVRIGEVSENEIPKSEAEYFLAPPLSSEDEFINRYTKAFSIVQLSFKSGQKWKLSDGHGAPQFVTVSDKEFLEKIDRNEETFAKGDLLICDVVETARRTASGFKSEYEIVRVKEHRRPPKQPPLPWNPQRSVFFQRRNASTFCLSVMGFGQIASQALPAHAGPR